MRNPCIDISNKFALDHLKSQGINLQIDYGEARTHKDFHVIYGFNPDKKRYQAYFVWESKDGSIKHKKIYEVEHSLVGSGLRQYGKVIMKPGIGIQCCGILKGCPIWIQFSGGEMLHFDWREFT